MSRRVVSLALASTSFLFLVLFAIRGQAAGHPSATRTCPGVAVDSTSPETRALLAEAKSFRPLGEVKVSRTERSKKEVQDFEVSLENRSTIKVQVSCETSGGCTSGCNVTGCNLTTINGQPACTAVQCSNSSGFPCGVQNAVCNKKETSGSPTAPTEPSAE